MSLRWWHWRKGEQEITRREKRDESKKNRSYHLFICMIERARGQRVHNLFVQLPHFFLRCHMENQILLVLEETLDTMQLGASWTVIPSAFGFWCDTSGTKPGRATSGWLLKVLDKRRKRLLLVPFWLLTRWKSAKGKSLEPVEAFLYWTLVWVIIYPIDGKKQFFSYAMF